MLIFFLGIWRAAGGCYDGRRSRGVEPTNGTRAQMAEPVETAAPGNRAELVEQTHARVCGMGVEAALEVLLRPRIGRLTAMVDKSSWNNNSKCMVSIITGMERRRLPDGAAAPPGGVR
jgi:hypothetical protein